MSMTDDPFAGRPARVFALVVLTAFSWLSVILLPLLISAYVRAYGLSEPLAGTLSTLEIGALSLATFLLSPKIHQIDKRVLCLGGAAAVLAGNVASCLFGSFGSLLASRVLVGVGQGMVVAATNALPAQSANGQRLYALAQIGLGIGASLLIFSSPGALHWSPSRGVFLVEIFAAVAALAISTLIPPGIERRNEGGPVGAFPFDGAVAGAFLSTTLFFVAQTAAWAFADRVGADRGIAPATVETYLGLSVLIGVAGSSTATWLGNRAGLTGPLIVGFLAVAILCVAMYSMPSRLAFVAGILLINVFIVFVTPYIFTVMAELDSYGRVASAGGAFTNLGNTIAPTLAGFASAYIGYASIGWASAACMVLGLLCIVPGARSVSKLRLATESPPTHHSV